MPIEIVVPRLGWSMDEGVFSEWLKNDGDWVAAGDMLFVLEGEKASQEIECFDSGFLKIPADAPEPGDVVQVGQVLGYLLERNEASPHPAESKSPRSGGPASPSVRRLARQFDVPIDSVVGTGPKGRITPEDVRALADRGDTMASYPAQQTPQGVTTVRRTITPRARRAAQDHGIDPTKLTGTGKGGRIRERDVLRAANRAEPANESILPITPLRRTIAQRVMAATVQTAPVTLVTQADAASLVLVREHFDKTAIGVTVAYTDIIVKVVAEALRKHPAIKGQWREQGIRIPEGEHIAFAVDTPAGLVAPVVRDVHEKSLTELAIESSHLIERAHARKLSPAESSGGVFTVSNLGGFAVDWFTPIINLPQTAILGIGRISEQPGVRDGAVTICKTVSLSLTVDHRVHDGAPAARFLGEIQTLLESCDQQLLGNA